MSKFGTSKGGSVSARDAGKLHQPQQERVLEKSGVLGFRGVEL